MFENYGQPNHIYFQYHGFSITDVDNGNSHDCVHFEFNITQEEGSRVDWKEGKPLAMKLNMQNKAVHITCLQYPISEKVWMFLSLKVCPFIGIVHDGTQ